MSAFTPVGADGGPLDATKSVRYVEGMVLGVDDFQQEHVYLSGLANDGLRFGAGVGTLVGLKVTTAKVSVGASDKFEVHVRAGMAIDGHGRIVRVPEEQCADLGAWVAAHANDIAAKLPAGIQGTLTIYVTVTSTQTATDSVPVPGEPCRSDDRLMAASRWRDDYLLNLSVEPVASSLLREAFRQYLMWTTYAFTFGEAAPIPSTAWDTKADSAAALLTACAAAEKTAETGRLLPVKLPGGATAVTMNKADVELESRCLDAASATLVSELLPNWLGTELADPPVSLLLAELKVAVKRAATTDPWTLDTAGAAPPTSSRARPVALGGPTLRIGPRLP
jgi:hypothetical protein